MDPKTFAVADELLDKIASIVDQKLESASFKDLRDAIERLVKALGTRYSASLQVVVDVFDRERERTIPLLTTGFQPRMTSPHTASGATRQPSAMSVRARSRLCPMTGVRSVGNTGISSSSIHAAPRAA